MQLRHRLPVDPNPKSLRPALFLDRDGTLMDEVDYCRNPEDVRTMPGVADRLARLRRGGWAVVIVTNQSGIGRGIITLDQYEAVHAELLRQLRGEVDATYFCADAPPTVSRRRKPGTGMVEEAVRDLGLDVARSYFIGDKAADIECGHAAGMPALLVLSGYGSENRGCGADRTFSNVVEALDWISARHGKVVAGES